MPEGADTVVPFEETTTEDEWVRVPSNLSPGSAVRPAGLDINAGDTVLEPGIRLTARHIGLCTGVGRGALSVYRRPVIGVLATGNELVEPGLSLAWGQIYNSNAHALAAAVRELGAEPKVLGMAKDDPAELHRVLASCGDLDLLVSSGGVSVGDFDYVKTVLEETGEIEFWRVRMRPGKPLMFGWLNSIGQSRTMILGLPGNPTSTMITFYVFAKPVILKMMGLMNPLPDALEAVADDTLDNAGGRETFFRVFISAREGRLHARLSGSQDSSLLLPLARANALVRVPADVSRVDPGESVQVYPLET